jgi:hypothetical protein
VIWTPPDLALDGVRRGGLEKGGGNSRGKGILAGGGGVELKANEGAEF